MGRVLLVACVVAYNNVLNRWPPFNGALYVPLNLIAAAVLLAVAVGPLGLDAGDIGITGSSARDAFLGGVAGAAALAPLVPLLRTPRGARLLADRRYARLAPGALAYHLLFRIPVGTALVEEVAFRGVVLAALQPAGTAAAAIVSSLAFGFWHVAPAVNLVRANRPHASRATTARAVAAAVCFTTLAGLLLVALRRSTGGLAAPVALHATVNALGALAAVAANRRVQRRPTTRPR